MLLEKSQLVHKHTTLFLIRHVDLARCCLVGTKFADRLQRNPLRHHHIWVNIFDWRLVLFLRLDHLRIVVVYDYNLNVFSYFVLIVSVVLRERSHGTIKFIALIPYLNINSTVRLQFYNKISLFLIWVNSFKKKKSFKYLELWRLF